jgi:hypothetical protein
VSTPIEYGYADPLPDHNIILSPPLVAPFVPNAGAPIFKLPVVEYVLNTAPLVDEILFDEIDNISVPFV